MSTDRVLIQPQPLNGRPFRIAFVNRSPAYWYNVRLAWSERGHGDMFFEWKCPFGVDGAPVFQNGQWYWEATST